VEAIASHTIIYEQINSIHIKLITSDVLKPRLWDLINKRSSWQRIDGQKNVEELSRNLYGGGGGGDGPLGPSGAAGALGVPGALVNRSVSDKSYKSEKRSRI
jgi:hypothetical protein